MRICILILLCSLSQRAFAGGVDSCAAPVTDNHIAISLSANLPPTARFGELRAIKYVPEYKIRKKLHRSYMMLYTGGALALASLPVIITAATMDNRSTNQPTGQRSNGGSFYLGMLGGLIAGAGVGLVIPGSLLHHKYKRQLEVQYPVRN